MYNSRRVRGYSFELNCSLSTHDSSNLNDPEYSGLEHTLMACSVCRTLALNRRALSRVS